MKFKKIFTLFLVITLIFIFNINVSADVITAPFTNTYRNPDIQTYMLDASIYAYNNVSSSQYPYDKHIRFLVMEPNVDKNGDRVFRHEYFSFNEINSQIKIYDGFIYFYVKGFIRYQLKFTQDVLSGHINDAGQGIYSYSSTSKAVIKLALDKSSIKYKFAFSDSKVNSVDDYIVREMTNNFSYYTLEDSMFFCELNSMGSLSGETYINNADIGNPRYYGITLVDKQKFIDWIIENQKYMEFADYGISTASNYVDDIINLYEEFNSSPLKFFTSIPEFLVSNGSIFANVDKAKQLYNLIDKLYQEFKISQQQKIFEVGTNNNLLPHQRINPNTDNPIYIEDINDTLDIKLLREILKTLIQTPNIIYDLFDYYLFNISSNVSLIADYIAQLPQYLTELMYNKFISPIHSIIDSINNIDTGGSTSIDVIIPIEKEVEFNDFLNLWNNNFNDIIDNKFPVANQLSSLFDDFFVKAGISTDKDDLIYSYYNPNIVGSTGDADLSDFYSTFDDADTSYLNDVGYSEDIPSLSIKIKGVKTEVINFKFYAKYRKEIFTIMSFILWFAFLLSLYKSLPKIIGNVSDIVNTVDEFESKIDKGDNW